MDGLMYQVRALAVQTQGVSLKPRESHRKLGIAVILSTMLVATETGRLLEFGGCQLSSRLVRDPASRGRVTEQDTGHLTSSSGSLLLVCTGIRLGVCVFVCVL